MEVKGNIQSDSIVVDETGIYLCKKQLVEQMNKHLNKLEKRIDNLNRSQTQSERRSEYKVAFIVLGFLVITFGLIALRSYNDYLYM